MPAMMNDMGRRVQAEFAARADGKHMTHLGFCRIGVRAIIAQSVRMIEPSAHRRWPMQQDESQSSPVTSDPVLPSGLRPAPAPRVAWFLLLTAFAALQGGCSEADEEVDHGAAEDDGEYDHSTEALADPGAWSPPEDVRNAGAGQFVPYHDAPPWNGGANCGGKLHAGTRELGDFLKANFPGSVSSYGGYSCRQNTANAAKTSVHGTGRALDVFIPLSGGQADNDKGDKVANWGGSRSGDKLKPYTGPHPHHDHLHVELTHDAAAQKTPWFNGGASTPVGGGVSKERDLYAIRRNGGSGKTEVHILSGASAFKDFSAHAATDLHPTDGALTDVFTFGVGEFDGDGKGDVYAISRRGGSGKTEAHILDARTHFSSFLAHSATGLHATDGASTDVFEFGVGDFNGDGRDDIYAISRKGGSGNTEVHVLNAADNFQTFLAHAATELHATDGANTDIFEFGVGDFNGDGKDDLYAISRKGGSGNTEVHVLDAATSFKTFLAHAASGLHATDGGLTDVFEFGVGDDNGDGKADVFAIQRNGGSGKTEVHVLDAASAFKTFLVHAASGLHPTDGSLTEVFELGVGAF
jgi:hypothetical protein